MPRLRAAGPEDAATIAAIINRAYQVERFFIEGDRTDPDEVRRLMEKGAFLVMEDEGVVAGCVYVEPQGDRGYFGLLAVEPARHGKGMGRSLVAAAEDHLRAAGCAAADILVVDVRIELPPFYRRLGYTETGTAPFPPEARITRPCYFIRMSKVLTSASAP